MLRDEMWKEQPPQQAAGREAMSTRMKMSKSRRQKRLAGQSIARKYQRRAAIRQAEYRRLKAIVPSVADKKSVTKVLLIFCRRFSSFCPCRSNFSNLKVSGHPQAEWNACR